MIDLKDKLLEKSSEAFIMALEIYNKPTIKYRVEGFSFFICNAWELMLKSHMLNVFGDKSIYYTNQPDRTLSLEACIKKIFTNNKDPLRINLEKIIELRNVSTHFITEEYEQIYVPLFQSCVMNYSKKLLEFFNFDITKLISQNFLTLSINLNELTDDAIKARYSEEMANKILKTSKEISDISSKNNANFSISIVHELHLTKDKKSSTAEFRISKSAKDAAYILKDIRDPKETHKYPTKLCIDMLNKKIKKDNLDFQGLSKSKGKENIFNTYHFGLFVDFYNLKSDLKYCYKYDVHQTPSYSYSQSTIDLIYSEIKKDPEYIIQKLKNNIKKS